MLARDGISHRHISHATAKHHFGAKDDENNHSAGEKKEEDCFARGRSALGTGQSRPERRSENTIIPT